MSGTWGKNFKLSIFGESHGEGIGILIDGIKPGIEIDMDRINLEMDRRKPGKNKLSTPRKENDEVKILSGFFNGRTTGTPLCAFIQNGNQHSGDYSELKKMMRPGHADYTGNIKYNGFNDYRGGGHFSGRLTAPLVFAGAVAKQIIEKYGIIVASHILKIDNIEDNSFDYTYINSETADKLSKSDFPVLDDSKGKIMQEYILKCREEKDSAGGVIEAVILNPMACLGSPFFDSFESVLSHLLFSIPAVKGVEFGEGFSFAQMKGSQANDEFFYDNGNVKTRTNNNGGILGGITDGMPIVFKTVVKPTPSIGKKQNTIDIEEKQNCILEIKGRHDPCIVQRAVPVIEAAAAIATLELIMQDNMWRDFD